jgi:hypothetical protein
MTPGKAGVSVPEGRGVSPGDCGTAYLNTTNGNKFLLILDSSQGVIGTGTYQAFTDGIGELPFFGGISGHDSIIWISGWQTIWDAGLWPHITIAEGWVTTARAGLCFFIVSAPAY